MSVAELRIRPAAPFAAQRLAALACLDEVARRALDEAAGDAQLVRARRDLFREGEEITHAKLILTGWAARVKLFPDGRRQFLSVVLPGEIIGIAHQPRPLSVSTVVALTDVTYCIAPPPATSRALARAYALNGALEEAYLLGHIARIGRLAAQERIADFFLELHERLSLSGLVWNDGYDLPITQEMLGDALGLTSVHVNRMLQVMRREGDLEWKGRRLVLEDPVQLARKIGRVPVRVSAE